MRTLITGATGFVGTRLIESLDDVVVLSRDAAAAERKLASDKVKAFTWRPTEATPPREAFEGVEAVINLAGESVAEGRWNEAKLKRIRDSRVVGTQNLVDSIATLDERPKVLVSASAVGYYGDRPDEILEETSPPGDDLLANICIEWEREAMKAAELGLRVVCLRIGVVLGRGGGAMGKMMLPFKLGLGGRLASGKQWMPWVHLDDVVGLLLHGATNESVRGPMNGVAPGCVTNTEFTKALGRALNRPTIFPVPAFGLRLGLGGFADVLLSSQQIKPAVAEATGYQFRYPQIDTALTEIVTGGAASAA
ncbi:MAG: TIGR01777 family protein [Planctomycetota bacterium]|nr:MAG: TIGR01777 family protein [Planctomycetota bacterium]REK21745.1 MAG: TIGR01777 family protein [Planctomycetota bacterium]REK43151.1 MAG: TIGR01777 family protein [Planctomycetota bacterium]